MSKILERINAYLSKYVHQISQILLLIFAILLIFYRFFPPIFAWIAELVGGTDGLLVVLLAPIVILIFDKVYEISERIGNATISQYTSEARAYIALSKIIATRNVKNIDLLQVSGQTAIPLLSDISELYPNAEIRLLLLHKDIASKFDLDKENEKEYYDHCARIDATLSYLKTLDLKNINIRYYRSYPGVCSVVINRDIVCLGWYRTFFDSPTVIRVRSHNVPAIIALDHDTDSLLPFARDHFEKIWEYSEKDSQVKLITSTIM